MARVDKLVLPAPQRVVVTGGSGFVGRNLVRSLRSLGYDAISFDLKDGADICDTPAVASAVEGARVVVHLAAWADLYAANVNPLEAVRVNVLGTSIVADACGRAGVRLIHGSTACVYGNQSAYPSHEDATPNPTEIYAQSKLAAEQVVQGFVASFGLDAVIARFPGVYGEGLRGALAVARFMERALADGVLEVHGDGLQTRTPIYVGDLVRGLVALVERPHVSGVINLGTSEEISALDLARAVRDLVGAGRIEHVGQRLPQTHRELVDWSRAQRELEWAPQTSLAEGLARTLAWMRRSSSAAPTRVQAAGQPLEERAVGLLRQLVELDTMAGAPGVRQAVELLQAWLAECGFECQVVHAPNSSPAIIARRPALGGGRGRVLLYNHYDAVGHAPLTERDGRIYGAGVGDNKGPLAMRAAAFEQVEHGPELLWLIQGEEESGSAVARGIFGDFLNAHPADLYLDESGWFDADGTQRVLACTIDARGEVAGVDTRFDELIARLHAEASWPMRVETRTLDKHLVPGGCPFRAALPAGARYLSVGPLDSLTRIHWV